MSVISAVNAPSFGAQPLTGVKRGRIGPPTSVPTNLPSFRGVPNNPGQSIRSPLLVNGNRDDRGTNATIPYARKVDRSNYLGDIAELGLGDVAFVRRGAPDFELGYDVNRVGRLMSLIRLNEELRDHEVKMPDGTYANIVLKRDYKAKYVVVPSPPSILDACPTLREWWLDGVVLSTDEPECYHVGLPTQGFNQVYNIAVAGHAAVNNGFSPVINEDSGPKRRLRNTPRIHTAKGPGVAGTISSSRNGRMVVYKDKDRNPVSHMQYEQVHYVHAQTFTRKPQMLETFYLALIQTYNSATASIPEDYYSFQYLEVTSSQLNAAGGGFKWMEDPDFGSMGLFQNLFGIKQPSPYLLVGLFKLGRVCDTKAAVPPGWHGAPPDRGYRVTLSVNIEWMELNDAPTYKRIGWNRAFDAIVPKGVGLDLLDDIVQSNDKSAEAAKRMRMDAEGASGAPAAPAAPKRKREMLREDQAEQVHQARKRLSAVSSDTHPIEEFDLAQKVINQLVAGLRGPAGEIAVQSYSMLTRKLKPTDERASVVIAARISAGIPILVAQLKRCLGPCWIDGVVSSENSVNGGCDRDLPLTEEGTASMEMGNRPMLIVTSVPRAPPPPPPPPPEAR